jgi:hypothetical protein
MVKRYATLDENVLSFNEGATNPRFDTIMQLNQKLGFPNEPSE